jgi:hypothetical protein
MGFFFPLQFCYVAEVTIIHKTIDLARFGYMLPWKVFLKKDRILLCPWLAIYDHTNLAIWNFFLFGIW